MQVKKIREKVRNDCYQLFVLDSPLPFPLCFIKHSFVVVNDHGLLTRWDVLHKKYVYRGRRGYVYKNLFSPWCGLGMLYFPRITTGHFFHFQPRLIGLVEGSSDSDIGQQIASLESLIENYIYKNRYCAYPGPNSNTFVQWVLDFFVDSEISLSATAVGKSYY